MMSLIRRLLTSGRFSHACRLVLAVVFVAAALGKISDLQRFADQVAGYHLLPVTVVNLFAITLPWVELLAGLSLLVGTLARQAGLLLVVLNLVFLFAVTSAMMRGLDIECGCFTVSRAHDHVGWGIICRDIFFLALCLPVIYAQSNPKPEPAA